MKQTTCANCQFYYSNEEECRKNPPVLRFSKLDVVIHSEWPKVKGHNWCGQFKSESAWWNPKS